MIRGELNRMQIILILNLLIAASSCKKDQQQPLKGGSEISTTTSSAENLLFTIKENGGVTFDVKRYFGNIIICNQNTGASSSQENSYKITDSYGKVYEFNSYTTFENCPTNGFFGLIKIFKNNVQIYQEKYDTSTIFHTCGTIDSYTPNKSTGSPQTSSIGASDFYWTNGTTITVNFFNNEGDAFIQQEIQKYAHIWEQYANIKFQFVSSSQPAQVRIEIASDNSSYTTGVGTQILSTPSNQPSMHFGWFTDQTADSEFSRTATHEFGHILGLEHEMRNPSAQINESAYFAYLMQTQGWTLAQAQAQAAFFTAQDQAALGLQYTAYDPLSIMHYPVPASCTTNGVAVGMNNNLSSGDISFIGTVYPFPTSPTNPATTNIIYTINNSSGTPQIDIVRGTNGLISLVNRQPGTNLSSTSQEYLIFTRTQNKDWYNIAYTFYSNNPLSANTSTGITNFGPSKGQSIMIERRDPGQSSGILLFMEN